MNALPELKIQQKKPVAHHHDAPPAQKKML